MSLSIREATVADAGLIADLSRQTFYDTFAPHNTAADMTKFLDEQFTRGRLLLEVGQPQNSFYLAYADGEVAGYLKLREGRKAQGLKSTSALEIARLYACSNMIGKGVGKLLMQKSLDMARQKEKEIIWLCVWEKNQRALDFYHSWGFEKCGDVDFLLGDDLQHDWVMQRSL
jgi:ribosomal protein S18 acetylase RimI-like enzyme